MNLPPPLVPPCMLFCDVVIVDRATGKTTLVNTFSGIAARVFPSSPRDFHVYVQLTSYIGEVELRLVCARVDLPEAEEIYATVHRGLFRGKLMTEEMLFSWRQFQFPAPGIYAIQLWSEGLCIAERRLSVRRKEE